MRGLLLDTCALVWWMADAAELSPKARTAIADPRTPVFVSAASLWEIAIKTRLGRLTGTAEYLARYPELHGQWGFSTLVIEAADAVAAGELAVDHADPFDRMLIVQAARLDCAIVTCDTAIRRHAKRILW